MKKIYSLFSILCIGLVFSQTILNQSETASRTVQDPQTVIMLPGFHANSTTVSPFVAKIGDNGDSGEIIDSGAGATNPYGTLGSNIFHDTQGNIDVNGSGQLQYTLPIALPPGIKSVAPQINLGYTSGSGNGIAGYGWNLSGITSISRMSKTIEKDGEVKGIQLNYFDYYSFNGQRLILKSGSYGADGAEYVTEKFSNVKIKSLGSISGQLWQGPEYWEVTFEDGSQAWYGGTSSGKSNARTPIEYNIVKWKDAQGNYITYDYEIPSFSISTSPDLQTNITISSNNVSIIKRISWGGNETLNKPHFNSIDFNYITRDLKEVSYVNAVKFLQDKLLSNIVVKSNNIQFKKYVIEYSKDTNNTNYQFANKITEYNSVNEAANSIILGYEPSTFGTWKYDYKSISSGTKLHGDFNGDGKIDIIRYLDSFEECAKWETILVPENVTDETGQYTTHVKERVCTGGFTQMPAGLYLYRSTFDSRPDKKVYSGTLDITKDDLKNATPITYKRNDNYIIPKQGFAVWKKISTTNNSDIELKIYSIDNDSILRKDYSYVIPYSTYSNAVNPDATSDNTNIHSITEMDVDGNGFSEIVLTLKNVKRIIDPEINKPLPYNYYNALVINPNTGQSNILFSNWGEHDIMSEGKIGDYNGDGKTDILVISDANNLYKPTLYEFSYNNSNGKYISTSYQYGTNSLTGVAFAAVTGDFNGDGKTDLMIPFTFNSFDWRLYTSTGKGFEEQLFSNLVLYSTNSEHISSSGEFIYNYVRQYYAQDVNKDGKSDLVAFYSKVYMNSNGNKNSAFIIDVYENKGISDSNSISFTKKGLVNYNTNISNWFGTDYKGYPFNYIVDGKKYSNTPEASATSSLGEHYSPVIGNFRINTSDETVLVFHNSTMAKFSYYDFSKETRINKITQGGLKTEIEYKELDPYVNTNFYAPVKKEQFPYLELDRVSQSFSVSQLRQDIVANGENKTRKQDFIYRGLISHLQGKGMIGFRQTARSSWYTDDFANTKIWSGAEIDPINEGLPIKEWSIKTNTDSQIFPTNISESNTQLLSFKSTQYKIDKLLNGSIVDINTVSVSDKPKIVTAIVPIKNNEKDCKSSAKSGLNY